MRHLPLCFIFFIALSATDCKKNTAPAGEDACGVKDPVSNLPWLKEKVDSLRAESLGGQVRRYRHNGQDIISIHAWIQSCYPCNLYTCFGQPLTQNNDGPVIQAIMDNLDDLKVIAEF
jgi:hypothetical protein